MATPVETEVLRQALIEYIDARHCLSAAWGERSIEYCITRYVDGRYARHEQKFRDTKIRLLMPRMEAAIRLYQDMVSAQLQEQT